MTGNTSTTASEADRQAVSEVLKRLYKAWEANDAGAFVTDYLDDASVVQPGIYKQNRAEIRTTMAAGFAGPLQGSRVINHPRDIRFPTDETAIVVSEDGILFPGQDVVPNEALVRATWVLCKRSGSWYVAAYHNSPAS
jgi:uncharacterized protein (TIGR02246 family)